MFDDKGLQLAEPLLAHPHEVRFTLSTRRVWSSACGNAGKDCYTNTPGGTGGLAALATELLIMNKRGVNGCAKALGKQGRTGCR